MPHEKPLMNIDEHQLVPRSKGIPMNRPIRHAAAILFAATSFVSVAAAQKIDHPKAKTFVVTPYPMDAKFKNAVDAEYEEAFMKRAHAAIYIYTLEPDGSFKKKIDQRTFFESEKWSYPAAMRHIIAGNDEPGLKILQMEDSDAKKWHQHTDGIDLFPAFTLKGQMRKYYFFGPMLEPSYRERMTRAFDLWTKTNPRQTPHPIFLKFNPNVQGWTPERFGNLQCDSRNTDNLRAMRDIAIYLAAEETGNTSTQNWARAEISRYVTQVYTVGMGEWDSETYHCHSVAAYLNLYDFAKDPQVKMQAKIALDHLHIAAALKYHNGVFAGPSKRDYGWSYAQFGGASAKYFALIFGDVGGAKMDETSKEHDIVHAITSNYRPPRVAIDIATGKFDRPVELLATKPTYEAWKDGASDRPEFFETLFYGRTYQMGSVVSMTPNNDTSPFRLVADGAKVFTANSRSKLHEKFPGDQIGQYRNLLLWLRPTDKANNFTFFLPKDVKLEQSGGVWFANLGKTYLALFPVNLDAPRSASFPDPKMAEFYNPTAQLFEAPARSDAPYAGFALEVGETGSFDAFKQSVLDKSKLEFTPNDGILELTSSAGDSVQITHSSAIDLPKLLRNGEPFDYNDPANFALWRTVGDKPFVNLGWKTGELSVTTPRSTFTATLKDGQASFTDK
jgi:hypothetical protein